MRFLRPSTSLPGLLRLDLREQTLLYGRPQRSHARAQVSPRQVLFLPAQRTSLCLSPLWHVCLVSLSSRLAWRSRKGPAWRGSRGRPASPRRAAGRRASAFAGTRISPGNSVSALEALDDSRHRLRVCRAGKISTSRRWTPEKGSGVSGGLVLFSNCGSRQARRRKPRNFAAKQPRDAGNLPFCRLLRRPTFRAVCRVRAAARRRFVFRKRPVVKRRTDRLLGRSRKKSDSRGEGVCLQTPKGQAPVGSFSQARRHGEALSVLDFLRARGL